MVLWIFSFLEFKIVDVIDVLLVALLLYQLYRLLKGTAAMKIFLGILAVFFIWKIVDLLQMELLSEIFGQFISVGVIALLVVFQPEIRKFLLMIGTPNFLKKRKFLFWKVFEQEEEKLNIDDINDACKKMSTTLTGALIVISRQNELNEYIDTGELLDARISTELLENIFFKNSPLHDGAIIISNNRIKAARCILPVSGNQNLPPDLGLRHRSALGITENTDAIAIIVSEQTGYVSICIEGNLKRNVKPSQLKALLLQELYQN
jgi:diadenylate cyclase